MDTLSRRRLLKCTVGTAALAGAMAVGLPVPAGAATGASVAGSGGRKPGRHVRDILPTVSNDAIALTIDDGPDPLWTPQILDLLRRNGVRATFSLIGRQAHAYPTLVKRIIAEGHGVCNHSMTHPQPFSARSAAAVHQEIADAQSAIVDAGGVAPVLFRAPGGDWSAGVLSAVAGLALVPLGWDVDPRDWSRPGTATVTSRLLAARPGDILLCHDGGGDRAQTVESLRTVLPTLNRQGLRFVTL
ncbi:MAG: polysaccharide deacetylase family protein [Pseudonocardiales bacterium]|nr:polysaccharide deacetylase family protein [Pseudonocardiales bacterium]